MYYNIYQNDFEIGAGIPYDEIKWYNIEGQPFGSAVHFNVIAFENGVNIVDIQGAAAIGENFISSRGFSVGFGKGADLTGTGYSPDLVRFMVGNNVTIDGTLTAVGNVVVGNKFFAESGSTYLIGKNFMPDQEQSLAQLYEAPGGSQYWRPANKGNYYAISSYDVPRVIPASRINADLARYFYDARNSIENFKSCIEELPDNGETLDNFHEWLLVGEDETQNVFTVDVTNEGGALTKGITMMVPESSISIIRIKSGPNAFIRYGLWGDRDKVNQTLYVFEDATNIYMDVPAAIWGSILAPNAIYHGHSTGGTVAGNAAIRGFEVESTSGFEFHWYPFIGGVICSRDEAPGPVIRMPAMEEPTPMPSTPMPSTPMQPTPMPASTPIPVRPSVSEPAPVKMPVQRDEEPAERPVVDSMRYEIPLDQLGRRKPKILVPEFTIRIPREEKKPRRRMPAIELVPEVTIVPEDRSSFEHVGTGFTAKMHYEVRDEQMPVDYEYRNEASACPICSKSPYYGRQQEGMEDLIEPGMIRGRISGCLCCQCHEWKICLYMVKCNELILVDEEKVMYDSKFEFAADEQCSYVLKVIPMCGDSRVCRCKPRISFHNVGVLDLTLDI